MPGPIARIDLARLRDNITAVRARLRPGIELMFVVKSDAYGHGLVPVAQAGLAAGVDRLGVVTVEEGSRLRAAGIVVPILLLGPILPEEIPRAVSLELEIPVSDSGFAARIAAAGRRSRVRPAVQVKVDTGMRRFGVRIERAEGLVEELSCNPDLRVVGIYTHLSSAESRDPAARAYTLGQIESFTALLHSLERRGLLPPFRHIANSAGFIQYQEAVTTYPFNMVRIGTLIYGYPEVEAPWTAAIRPVAHLTAPVVALREVGSGSPLGYSRRYRASSQRRVAVIAAGYGTGIPPCAADGGGVWIRGGFAPILGGVYLDHTMVDVTGIAGVEIGDEAEIIGPHIPADRFAARIGLHVCEFLVPALAGAERRFYR